MAWAQISLLISVLNGYIFLVFITLWWGCHTTLCPFYGRVSFRGCVQAACKNQRRYRTQNCPALNIRGGFFFFCQIQRPLFICQMSCLSKKFCWNQIFCAAGANCWFFGKSFAAWTLFIIRQSRHFNLSIWCHSIGISFGQFRSVLSSIKGSVHKLCNTILENFLPPPRPSVTPFALA